MRRLLIILLVPFIIPACGQIDLPTPAEQAEARAALPGVFAPVSLSRRSEDKVIALRWTIEEPVFSETLWQWREIEVTAQAGPEGTRAVTVKRRISLDPRALSKTVPAAYSRDTWALELNCDEGPCIEKEVTEIVTEDGERTFAETETRRGDTHLWLFETYPPRDRALTLVRRAIGAPPR